MKPELDADAARYALYFTPPNGSLWSQLGNAWLGQNDDIDALTNAFPRVGLPGLNPGQALALVSSPRRYGFHATLKAPFRLRPEFCREDLLASAAAFARSARPIVLPPLEVRLLGDYFALCFAGVAEEIDALAMRCVTYFDYLRANPDGDELKRRRRAGLTMRQEQLLSKWGYPFTEEQFRFHMTLTSKLQNLESASIAHLLAATNTHFAPAIAAGPLPLDGLTVCVEPVSGAPFAVLERFVFSGSRDIGQRG